MKRRRKYEVGTQVLRSMCNLQRHTKPRGQRLSSSELTKLATKCATYTV